MARDELTVQEAVALSAQASKFFRPRTPITTKELFAGRWKELTKVADTVNQPGLHAVIYGERGVGKTSLANVVSPTIWALDNVDREPGTEVERLVIKVVAGSGDTFSDVWDKAFKDLAWRKATSTIGFITGGQENDDRISVREAFGVGNDFTVDQVRRILTSLPSSVFIVDEFDRVARRTSKSFTDLIKTLSDLAIDCTVILVGVSDTVEHLVSDHASINRCLVQVLVQRMKAPELRAIIRKAEDGLKITFSEDAANLVVRVSQGLPHYTHLIGLHALRDALNQHTSRQVDLNSVFDGLRRAVKEAEQTVTQKFSTAIHSTHKEALYRHVLLACALAAAGSQDPLGYFVPSSVQPHLAEILKRKVTIATFTNHLSEFCQEKRGEVLERDGQPWGFRYRFQDPLLVPYIFMNAVEAGLITRDRFMSALDSTASPSSS